MADSNYYKPSILLNILGIYPMILKIVLWNNQYTHFIN